MKRKTAIFAYTIGLASDMLRSARRIERGEEALAERVVVAVAHRAHRGPNSHVLCTAARRRCSALRGWVRPIRGWAFVPQPNGGDHHRHATAPRRYKPTPGWHIRLATQSHQIRRRTGVLVALLSATSVVSSHPPDGTTAKHVQPTLCPRLDQVSLTDLSPTAVERAYRATVRLASKSRSWIRWQKSFGHKNVSRVEGHLWPLPAIIGREVRGGGVSLSGRLSRCPPADA